MSLLPLGAGDASAKHARENPSPDKTHKRPKRDPAAHPPFDHFTLIDNDAQGDCAYLAIAMALADANKANQVQGQTVANDFAPGGRLQAQLRLLASKELGKNPSRYFAPGDGRSSSIPNKTATAGTWADSVSLSALCQASQIELRIWGLCAKDNRWVLYILAPFLHLKDQHYQWLKPKDGISSDLVDTWIRSACYKPATLRGAGKSQFGPDAFDILGLAVPSAPARSVSACSSQPGSCAGSAPAPTSSSCPCGWKAPINNSARQYAITHWRACQGTSPPVLAPGWRKGFAAQLLKSGSTELRRKKAVAKFEAWLAEFKAKKPKIASAPC